MNGITYADIYRPTTKARAIKYDIGLIIGGSLFIAICAQISVYIPFNPVPITGQTFGVLLIGALLGSIRGGLAILAYISEGAAGLPFFAGGNAGLLPLIGPTGGYLIGFVLGAYVVGRLAESGWDRRVVTVIPAMVIGTLIIFSVGIIRLTHFVGIDQVLIVGLFPFIPGALIKISLAAILLPWGWRFFRDK